MDETRCDSRRPKFGSLFFRTTGRIRSFSRPTTINFSGTGSGTAWVYFDFANKLHVDLPADVKASCTGNSCAATNTNIASNGSCALTDNWPKNSDGNTKAAPLGCISINNGQITNIQQDWGGWFFDTNQIWWAAGAQTWLTGGGPGPFLIDNNHMESSGNPWHFDDSGLKSNRSGEYGYQISRNDFIKPAYCLYSPTDPKSYKIECQDRQSNEFKAAHKVWFRGNRITGFFNDESPTATSFVMYNTGNASGNSDFDLEYNTWFNIAGLGQFGAGTFNPATLRTRFANNIVYALNPNMYQKKNNTGFGSLQGNAWLFYGFSDIQDFTIDHNTLIQSDAPGWGGRMPTLFYTYWKRAEGMKFTNNIVTVAPINGNFGARQEAGIDAGNACTAFTGGAYAKCMFPNADFSNNVFLPILGATSQDLQNQWCAAFPKNFCALANPTASGFASFNAANPLANVNDSFKLTTASLIQAFAKTNATTKTSTISGSDIPGSDINKVQVADGTTILGSMVDLVRTKDTTATATIVEIPGANIDAVNAAQGIITSVNVSKLAPGTAQINFTAPDSNACAVDWAVSSDTDPNLVGSFTRVADTSNNGRSHAVVLNGLPSLQTIRYRVNCAVQQPIKTFTSK
jgi:hypothetical protein